MNPEIAKNRKARRDYDILEKFEAGIALIGSEVKSIRAGNVNIADAFARVENDEVILYGCSIQAYAPATHVKHEEKRPRKLLLHRKEIYKLLALTAEKGLALVALRMYWKGQRVKVEIGVEREAGAGQAGRFEEEGIGSGGGAGDGAVSAGAVEDGPGARGGLREGVLPGNEGERGTGWRIMGRKDVMEGGTELPAGRRKRHAGCVCAPLSWRRGQRRVENVGTMEW